MCYLLHLILMFVSYCVKGTTNMAWAHASERSAGSPQTGYVQRLAIEAQNTKDETQMREISTHTTHLLCCGLWF